MLARFAVAAVTALILIALVLSIGWTGRPAAPAVDRIERSLTTSSAGRPALGDPGALAAGTRRHGPPRRLEPLRDGRRAAGGRRTAAPAGATPSTAVLEDRDARDGAVGRPLELPAEAAALLAPRAAGGRRAADVPAPAPPRAAPWTADQLLANPTRMNDEYVALAASPASGHLFGVFAAYDLGGGDRDIYIARSLDQGATWTTVKMPTFSLDESMPDLAIDAAGYLHVVWVRADGVLVRARSAGPEDIDHWAYVQAFVVGEPVAVPSVAVSGSGDFARLFIACSWYTVNWNWYQNEYTLLWLTSTNGGQTVAYDYLEPDGHPDLWPVVAMHEATVYMVNGEQDPYSGRIRILAAADGLSGSFADYIDLTAGSPMSNGFPSIAADGPGVHIAYQLDWDAGPSGIDGDVMYVFSWDGLATAYGPYAIMATTSESVGPRIAARGGLVGCVWLEAPAGGDEFHLASRQAPLDGHPDYWGEAEQVTDQPMVVPQYRAAAMAVAGGSTGGSPQGPLVAMWMDRRAFNTEGFDIYTSRRPLRADLAPFAPDGWQSPLVLSMVPGEREDGTLAAGYPAYASLALANLGLAAAPGPVAVQLRLDGAIVGSWSVASGLPAGSYATAEDQVLSLSAGLRTLSLHLDPDGSVAESDETNNVLVKDVWVVDGDPLLALSPASLHLTADAPAARPLALRPGAPRGGVLDPRLDEALRSAGAGDRLRVVVAPRERTDPADLADRGRRGVRSALQQQVERFAAAVAAHHAAAGKSPPSLRSYWLSGELAGELTADEIARLAGTPAVGRLWLDDRRSQPFAAPAERRDGPAARAAWHLEMIGADAAWALGLDGDGVLVGHTDSGVAWDHPDLVGRLWDGLPDHPHHGYDFLDDDLDPYDDGTGDFWHGTHTAGLIVGAQHGAAPGARLLVARCVPGYYQDLVEALQFCLDHGCRLISTSAGWTQAGDDLRSANRNNAEIMLAMGVPWIAAAGNGDNQGGHVPAPHDISSPGDCPEPSYGAGGRSAVVTVGALRQDRQLWSYSSLGPTVWSVAAVPQHADYPYPPGLTKPDLVAPGDAVTSTVGGGGYAAYSGSSMATPLVAGAAAILLQANPALAPEDLAAVLTATAEDLGPAGRDDRFGAGLVDLPAALAALPDIEATMVWARNLGAVPLVIESIGGAAGWLQAAPASGTVAPGDSLPVVVSWDASGLAEGAYQTLLTFASNDPRGDVHLPVTLAVGQVASAGDRPPAAGAGLSIYPNPFNPATTIRFELAETGPVSLRVFDARGRLVRDLLQDQRPAGRHEAAWDGCDARGRPCASGVYLVRLQTRAGARHGRMLLAR